MFAVLVAPGRGRARVSHAPIMSLASVAVAAIACAASADLVGYGLTNSVGTQAQAYNVGSPVPADVHSFFSHIFGSPPPVDVSLSSEQSVPPDGITSAFALASQTASFANGTLNSYQSMTSGCAASPNAFATSLGFSTLIASFYLDNPTEYSLSATLSLHAALGGATGGNGSIELYLYRRVDGQAEYLINETIKNVDDLRTLQQSGTLAAGEYRLGLVVIGKTLAEQPGFGSPMWGDASLSFTVPTAPSCAILAGALFGRVRRRR